MRINRMAVIGLALTAGVSIGGADLAGAAAKAKLGGSCTAKQVGSKSTAANGAALVCTKSGKAGKWAAEVVSTTAAPSATAAPNTAAPAKSASVPGVSDTTIKIGLTGPYTGSAAVAGQGLRAGTLIAVDEINAAGGIGGRKVELVALDDGFDIPKLVANVRRLVDDEKVYAIVTPAGSQAIPGTWDFIKDKGTIMWAPVTPPDPKLPSVFILGASRAEQTRIGVDFMCEKGVKKIALIGQDNNLGAEGQAGMTIQVPKCNGMEVVASERVQPLSREVDTAVNKIVAAKADGVYLTTDNTQAALIVKRLRDLGSGMMVVAENGAGGPGSQNTVGQAGSAADGFYATMQQDLPGSEVTPGVIKWRTLAKKSGYPGAETNFALQTYGFTKIFFEVLKKVAATKDFSYANFQKVAETTRVDLDFLPPVICGPLPDGHSCARGAGVAQYKGGRWDQVRDFKTPK